MDIFYILVIGFVFYLGYAFGCTVTYFRVSRTIKQLADSLGLDIEHELNKLRNVKTRNLNKNFTYHSNLLETEVHGDMIYLFDKERNDFICQAKSIDELAILAKDIKKINEAVVKHGDKTFVFNDGKSSEKIT